MGRREPRAMAFPVLHPIPRSTKARRKSLAAAGGSAAPGRCRAEEVRGARRETPLVEFSVQPTTPAEVGTALVACDRRSSMDACEHESTFAIAFHRDGCRLVQKEGWFDVAPPSSASEPEDAPPRTESLTGRGGSPHNLHDSRYAIYA